MKLSYHPDTDSLYVDFLETPSVESREISAGVVLDYDAAGHVFCLHVRLLVHQRSYTPTHRKVLSPR